MQTMKQYDKKCFLYVRDEESGRFRAYDWNGDRFAGKRFFATMFSVEEKARVEAILAREENKGISWEWRG